MAPEMTLESIVSTWQNSIFNFFQGELACVELINLRQFKKLRTMINETFDVGDCEPYKGKISSETEFGDVTDVMIISLQEKFPPEEFAGKAAALKLSIEERKAWRDELIESLDSMAPR